MMDIGNTDRLKQVLTAYGAEPQNWPEDERDNLKKVMLASGAGLKNELRDAGELDAVLKLVGEPIIPEGALSRALQVAKSTSSPQVVRLAQAVTRRNRRSLLGGLNQALPTGIALAASLVLGILAGLDEQVGSYVPGATTIASIEPSAEEIGDGLISFDPFGMEEEEVL